MTTESTTLVHSSLRPESPGQLTKLGPNGNGVLPNEAYLCPRHANAAPSQRLNFLFVEVDEDTRYLNKSRCKHHQDEREEDWVRLVSPCGQVGQERWPMQAWSERVNVVEEELDDLVHNLRRHYLIQAGWDRRHVYIGAACEERERRRSEHAEFVSVGLSLS